MLKDLLDQFICVRLVKANGLDLRLFQFDYDLTFAAFFLNGDGAIYGRYGSRSEQKNAAKDISLEGLRKALAAALTLHRDYPKNAAALAGKRGPAPKYAVPEQMPPLTSRHYTAQLDYNGKLAASCIHCHMVGDAERKMFRDAAKPIPDDLLFSYPMPSLVGLELDPKEIARVTRVLPGSPAARAGFQSGDEIATVQGQPIISIADIQWVLQHAGDSDQLKTGVVRNGQPKELTLSLGSGWRRGNDFAWRTTTWDLRRMAFGGLVLEDLPDENRADAGLTKDALALRVKYVGQYGDHAAGKRAGFQKDDILVSVDGKNDRMSEALAIAYLVQNKKPGDRVPIQVLRGKERLTLDLPLQ